MDYARQILRTLLKEEARQIDVIDAIKKHYTVVIRYDSNDGVKKGKNYRVIQPVAYGLSKGGNLVIRAFQPLGDTESSIPSWKFFRLDRIKSWNPKKNDIFNTPPEGFNDKGDNTMSEVYLVADFGWNDDRAQKQTTRTNRRQKNTNRRTTLSDLRKNNNNQRNNRNDNSSSISDMSQIKFQNDKEQQTVGPVTKKNRDNQTEDNRTKVNYSTAIQNGPVLKNNVQQYTEPEDDNDEIFRTEDPLKDFKKNIENSYNGNDIDFIRRNLEFTEKEKENKRRKKENRNG